MPISKILPTTGVSIVAKKGENMALPPRRREYRRKEVRNVLQVRRGNSFHSQSGTFSFFFALFLLYIFLLYFTFSFFWNLLEWSVCGFLETDFYGKCTLYCTWFRFFFIQSLLLCLHVNAIIEMVRLVKSFFFPETVFISSGKVVRVWSGYLYF